MCLGCNMVFQLETSKANKAVHLLAPGCVIGVFHLQRNTVCVIPCTFLHSFLNIDAQQGAVKFHLI